MIHRPNCSRSALLASAVLLFAVTSPGIAGDEQAKDLYQDFRNRRPLLAEFRLAGAPDVDDAAKLEDDGLRITLPPAREKHWPIEVQANFVLTGDFEITGTYELLSAARPTKGYGVGVAINIATNNARDKFAKISRLMREGRKRPFGRILAQPAAESVPGPVDPDRSEGRTTPIGAQGASLRYLVSDAQDRNFGRFSSSQTSARRGLSNFTSP